MNFLILALGCHAKLISDMEQDRRRRMIVHRTKARCVFVSNFFDHNQDWGFCSENGTARILDGAAPASRWTPKDAAI